MFIAFYKLYQRVCVCLRSASYNQLTERAQKVFTSLTPLAVRQLVPMARAIILPVAMGISRPVDPNCMSDRRKTGEEIFRLPPVSLLRKREDEPADNGGGGGGGADHDAESEMGDKEEEITSIGVPAHDASSTATTGSNLLYLSDDQVHTPVRHACTSIYYTCSTCTWIDCS